MKASTVHTPPSSVGGGIPGLLHTLYPYTKPYLRRFAVAILLKTISQVVFLVLPQLVRSLLNSITEAEGEAEAHSQEHVQRGCLAMLVLYALRTVGKHLGAYHLSLFGAEVVTDLKNQLFSHLLKSSAEDAPGREASHSIKLINADTELVKTAVSSNVNDAVQAGLFVAGAMVLCLRVSTRLTGVLFAALLPLAAAVHLIKRHIKAASRQVQESTAHVAATAETTLDALMLVRAYGREAHEEARFREATRGARAAVARSTALAEALQSLVSFVTAAALVAVLGAGAREAAAARVGAGDLVSFVYYVVEIGKHVESCMRHLAALHSAAGAAERLVALLHPAPPPPAAAPRTPPDAPAPEHTPRSAPLSSTSALRAPSSGPSDADVAVEFRGVEFGYGARGGQVLRGVSFAVPRGAVCAVVGPSGGGKSSLLRLPLGLVHPAAGAVLVGGKDVRSWSEEALRAHIGWVPQSCHCMPGTVEYNIRYGRLDASDADVEAAARAAGAHDFIQALPLQYHTLVQGQRGLSGGEVARVCVARAVVRAPAVLLLDEASAGLDALAEAALSAAVRTHCRASACTALVVAHRLHSVQAADHIVVIEAGKVVQQGTHAELYSQASGLYRCMYDVQDKGVL